MIVYNKIEAGKRLSEIIADSGLKSFQFAESIGKDASYLSKMENGKKGISVTYLDAIEKKYGVNRQWLLFGNGPKYGQKVPHETNKKPAESSISAILEIASSNKVLAEANLTLADAHKILAKNNEDLISLLKLRSSADQQTFEETVATVLALREYLIEFAAEQKKVSATEVSQGFHSKVKKAMEKLGRKGNPVASGK